MQRRSTRVAESKGASSPAVRSFLKGYDKADWDRVVAAALEYGVHCLAANYTLPTLSAADVEAVAAQCRSAARKQPPPLRTQPTAADGEIAAGAPAPPRTKPPSAWRRGDATTHGTADDAPAAAAAAAGGGAPSAPGKHNAPEHFPFVDPTVTDPPAPRPGGSARGTTARFPFADEGHLDDDDDDDDDGSGDTDDDNAAAAAAAAAACGNAAAAAAAVVPAAGGRNQGDKRRGGGQARGGQQCPEEKEEEEEEEDLATALRQEAATARAGIAAARAVSAAAAEEEAAEAAEAAEAEAAEVELKGQEPSVAAVVPQGAQDVAAARHGALEERFELAKRLFDRGLIDGVEWRAKKAALLEEL